MRRYPPARSSLTQTESPIARSQPRCEAGPLGALHCRRISVPRAVDAISVTSPASRWWRTRAEARVQSFGFGGQPTPPVSRKRHSPSCSRRTQFSSRRYSIICSGVDSSIRQPRSVQPERIEVNSPISQPAGCLISRGGSHLVIATLCKRQKTGVTTYSIMSSFRAKRD